VGVFEIRIVTMWMVDADLDFPASRFENVKVRGRVVVRRKEAL